MLSICGSNRNRFCDNLDRRSVLRIGSLGFTAGLSLADILRASNAKTDSTKSVIMVYLCGGPTQFETFDPKPNAPVEIRGSFQPTATKIPGIQYCELLPRLSAINDKFSIIRSLVGMENRHESFQCYSGRPGGRPQDGEPAGGWPTFGSVISRELGAGSNGALPYVDASPQMGYQPYANRGIHDNASKRSWPGFTGMGHIPFAVEAEVKKDLILNGISLDRLGQRERLLKQVNNIRASAETSGIDSFQEKAFGILTSSNMARALDLENEPKKVRDWYGDPVTTDPSFGAPPQSSQHLLLARRLVEAGVRCVTVAFGAWDWHSNREGTIEYLSNRYLPNFDRAISVLLTDLEQRGLSEQVQVIVWGEFGRTPRINAKGGRDHWERTQSVLIAGGNVQPGRTIGTTDKQGGVPIERPIHTQEVFATMYQHLGLDVNSIKIPDLNGRPRYLVDENRQPIKELIT